MRLGIGKAALAVLALAQLTLLALPALAQQSNWVCFIEGGKREPAHFEPNGNVYVGRHATTEGLAFTEAIEACERGEGSRAACQGQMTPGAICREMDPQRAAAYQPVFRRPMNVTPGDYQCEARGTAPIGYAMGWNGQFHSTTNADYQAARRAMEALCTSATCEPMRCFRRSGTPPQQTQAQQMQPQPAAGGAGGGFQPGQVQYFWRQVGGNWRSPTTQSNVQACNYASAEACDAANVRAYAPGATQSLHLNGCNAPPIQVQCVVEARPAPPPPPRPVTPPAAGGPAPPPPDTLAQPGRPGWTVDARNGCWVWNAAPQPGATVTWDGACPRGPAEGPGSGEWRWTADGRALVARFEGPRVNGRQHGQGIYISPNGDRYDGEYRDGVRHGRAVFTWANGDQYEGDYRDGQRTGRGTLTRANGNRYVGEFLDGQRHGQGRLTFPGGDTYEGNFRDNKFHGQGIYIWRSGNRYSGEWKADRADGQGEYYVADTRNWYRGTWVGGCIRRADGRRAAVGRDLAECR
jgi:hypothetical protein